MNGDLTLLVILAVGTLLLNKDLILTEWFSATETNSYRKREEQP